MNQCIIKEQIITGDACGLTIQFEKRRDGLTAMRLFGKSLPFGNREILFDSNGNEAGAGTHTTDGPHKPTWDNDDF